GQASKQASAELDVLLSQPGKPVLQQRHDPLVIGRAGKDETAAVPCSSAGERAREAETPGQASRLEERLLRSRAVAGSCLRLAEREKKLAAHRVVFGARQLERLEGCLVLTNRFLVGEERKRPISRPPGVVDSLVELASRDRVVRELGEVRSGI